MPQIRVITFDLDNTLWNVQTVIQGAERQLSAWLADHAPAAAALYRNGGTLAATRAQVIAAQPHLVHDISRLREEILYVLLRRTKLAPDRARQMAIRAFNLFLEARHDVKFFDGALSALDDLSKRYTLGSLTNGNADPKKLKLDRYFSFSFCAADVGASKPAPDLFQKALAHNGASPRQAIHIGDHPVDDIEAAASIGMHTIWAKGLGQLSQPQAPNACTATEVIGHLSEVVAAIERIEQL